MILKEIGKEGQITRGIFQRRLPEDPSKDYFYIQRLTPNTTALLIEYGFIDNKNDLRKLQSNLLNYVEAVVRAVANYANVPYRPPTGSNQETYTVVAGDTLYSIAKKLNTTVDALMNTNNLTSATLRIGQVLTIPTTSSPSTNTYTVQRGDSLYSIAQRYNTTVQDLMNRNKLNSTLLQIGQVLNVPTLGESAEQNPGTYIVKRGDTLYSIARKYNTTVDELKRMNNLTSDNLEIDQILIVPTEEGTTYTVKVGDSLYKISVQYNVPVADIINLNKLPTTVLQVGQVLKIPR